MATHIPNVQGHPTYLMSSIGLLSAAGLYATEHRHALVTAVSARPVLIVGTLPARASDGVPNPRQKRLIQINALGPQGHSLSICSHSKIALASASSPSRRCSP